MSEPLELTERRTDLLAVLRQQGVTDPHVLDALDATPRERFLAADQHLLAYDNRPLPIGYGQTISQPFIVGLMTQAIELTGAERVLEIGTGSGYQAAVLSRLAQAVYTVERVPELAVKAKSSLESLSITNVCCQTGDGSLGWPEYAPFDRIIVTAAGPKVPAALAEQLRDEGILVMPVGSHDRQVLEAYRKRAGRLERRQLCTCRFVPLIGEQAWHID